MTWRMKPSEMLRELQTSSRTRNRRRSGLRRSEAALPSGQQGARPSFGEGWPRRLLVLGSTGPHTLLRLCLELCCSFPRTRRGPPSQFALGVLQGPSSSPPPVLGINQRETGRWSLAKAGHVLAEGLSAGPVSVGLHQSVAAVKL